MPPPRASDHSATPHSPNRSRPATAGHGGLHAAFVRPRIRAPRGDSRRGHGRRLSAGHLAGRLGPPETARSSQRRRSVHPALRPPPVITLSPGTVATAGALRRFRKACDRATSNRVGHLAGEPGTYGDMPALGAPAQMLYLAGGGTWTQAAQDQAEVVTIEAPHRPWTLPAQDPETGQKAVIHGCRAGQHGPLVGRALGQPAVASPACGECCWVVASSCGIFSGAWLCKSTLLPARHPRPRRQRGSPPGPRASHRRGRGQLRGTRGRDWSGRHRATKRRGTRCGD